MKQASMPDEACFMCQRSLLRWASKPISFFPYIFRKKTDSSEVRQLLSYLLELTGEPDSYLVEEILLDFVIGKGCTECSRTVCENIFGKHPTFADMMRHPWFEHLMNHPAQTEPYNPRPSFVRNDAFYWRNFHFPLFYHLQKGNSLALEVLDYLATKGDIPSMERVSLYYFDKCQFSKAFLLFKALHEKMQTTEWYDWAIKQEITYKLAHLYTYGEGVEQDLCKASQYYIELDSGYNWGNKALLESQQNLLLIDYQRIKYNKECNC